VVAIRSRGCAPGCGIALIAAGVVFLCINFGVIPWRIARWWPVLVIALGVVVFVRHYWLVFRQRGPVSRIPTSTRGAPVLVDNRMTWKPPVLPIVVAGIGVYLLLKNLGYLTFGVSVAVILIVCGVALLLAGSLSLSRRAGVLRARSGGSHSDT
jgi:LiaI-LiaF-like transmembrane region